MSKKRTDLKKKIPETPPKKKAGFSSWLLTIPVVIITFLCYLPSLSDQKEFINWDDPIYVSEQPLVKNFSWDQVGTLFKPSTQVASNYHPLTLITLAMNYKSGFDKRTGQISIRPFMLTNLMFHLGNCILVFFFILSLFKGRIWIAFFASLLFGIHPMHVESVAWISERKDVMYCFFFLLSCISYLRYLERKQFLWIGLSFLFFIFSCLSKAMAVPLPLVLLLIDFYKNRTINGKVILEKIPFLLIAVLIGYNALVIQSTAGAIAEFKVFTVPQRFLFASYGFMMYWVKLFLPIGLCLFYPYPGISESGNLPVIYWVAPLISLLIIILPLYFSKKIQPDRFRTNLLGVGFFFLMVVLVLQLISVGAAMYSERYTYLPYIGAFILIAGWSDLILRKLRKKNIVTLALIVFSGFCAYQTYARVQVWNNSLGVWSAVINKYPDWYEDRGTTVVVKIPSISLAHKNRAFWYFGKQEYDKAFDDLQHLVKTGTKDASVWSNLGNLYAIRKEYDKSLDAYTRAFSYDSTNYSFYLNRGITLFFMGRNAEVIEGMDKLLRTHPELEKAAEFKAKALLNSGRYPEAIAFCTEVLPRFPNNAEMWFVRGTSFINTAKFQEGVDDLGKAIALNPNTNNGYYFNLSVGLSKLGLKEKAMEQVLIAQKMGYPVPASFMNELNQK